MSSFGFDTLSWEGCVNVLKKYEDGIARIESGETKYAAGGNLRQLRRWHRQLTEEMRGRVQGVDTREQRHAS